MKIIEYNRGKAVAYAKRYAFHRNPAYFDFSNLGGDCTNFCSQCLYAGAPQMNYTKNIGWYYSSANERAPAWTGVNEFYKFLTDNIVINKIGEGYGPFGEEASIRSLKTGDFIQLGQSDNVFYHCLMVVGFLGREPLVSAHTFDVYEKPLSAYDYEIARGIKILGVRIK